MSASEFMHEHGGKLLHSLLIGGGLGIFGTLSHLTISTAQEVAAEKAAASVVREDLERIDRRTERIEEYLRPKHVVIEQGNQ